MFFIFLNVDVTKDILFAKTCSKFLMVQMFLVNILLCQDKVDLNLS